MLVTLLDVISYIFLFLFFSLYINLGVFFFIRSPNGAWLLQLTVKFEAFLKLLAFYGKTYWEPLLQIDITSNVFNKLQASVSRVARFCFIFFKSQTDN